MTAAKAKFGLIAAGSVLLLACGWLSFLDNLAVDSAERSEPPATRLAVLQKNQQLAAEAYAKTLALPGYRIERRHTVAVEPDRSTQTVVITEVDREGNSLSTLTSADEQTIEIYLVDGHSYIFDPNHSGWVSQGKQTLTEVVLTLDVVAPIALDSPAQHLAQFGAIPVQGRAVTYQERPATAYQVQHILNEMAETFGQELTTVRRQLTGTIWVDDLSGALLKSELTLFDEVVGHQTQVFGFEVSRIGEIPAIELPEPVIDPEASIAATATAQVWTVLQGTMTYRGTPITFELIPLDVIQLSNSSPREAEVQILLRNLPDNLVQDDNMDPFLTQLRQQLTFSIPKRNLIVTSSGYQFESKSLDEKTVSVLYFFNADLEDFERVELILRGQGNPQFAPVPVAGR